MFYRRKSDVRMSCKYKDIFGEPNKGAHSIRVFNLAVVDVVLTLLLAWVIMYYSEKNYWVILFILIIIGIFLHWLFCVNTKLNSLLGLN